MRKRVLADRNMRVLFIGQSMNMLGNYAMLVVLGIWVKTLTGSSADAGLIFLVLGASSFVAPQAHLSPLSLQPAENTPQKHSPTLPIISAISSYLYSVTVG